jgi:ketosteroid isomerase-like protein
VFDVYVCLREVSEMIRAVWLSLIPVVLAVGCQPKPADISYTQRTEIEDTVKQVADQFLRQSESGNVVGWMALFSKDENMRYTMGGSVWTRDALEAVHGVLMESQQEANWVWDNLHIVVLSADVAVLTGTLHGSITYKSGQTVSFDKAAMTMVLTRYNGEWKITNAHESFGAPPRTT